MSERETLACPMGRMLDYMACMQIENGASQKIHVDVDELENIE